LCVFAFSAKSFQVLLSLSAFFQFWNLRLFRSSMISYCHRCLGLPTGLVPIGLQSSSFLFGQSLLITSRNAITKVIKVEDALKRIWTQFTANKERSDLHKTVRRFILFAKYYCNYITKENIRATFITRVKETTIHSVLLAEREMEGYIGNPSVIWRVILNSGQK